MRSRLRYAAITILIASVPVVLMVLAAGGSGEPGTKTQPLGQTLLYGAALWYPWAIVAPFIDRLVRRARPSSFDDRVRIIARHAALALTFIIAHGATMQVVANAIEPEMRRSLWRAL